MDCLPEVAPISSVEPTPMVTVRVRIGLSGLKEWSHAFAPTIRLDKVVKIISKVLFKDCQEHMLTYEKRQWRIGIDAATDINDVVELRDVCGNFRNEIIFHASRVHEQHADAHRRAEALVHRRAEAECSQVLSTMRKKVQTIEASLRGRALKRM